MLLRISDTLEDVKRYEQRMLPAVDDNELLEERKSAGPFQRKLRIFEGFQGKIPSFSIKVSFSTKICS